ncbi:sugar ABC transporter substrate-binding protein [Kineococcus glutinatus]|uniref:Sugar ABC transporter substrate-binding protein n=1 Tax=Kineococcus glutinatus TaxID=1070872 RepID=A0ABP9I429_9ACTN
MHQPSRTWKLLGLAATTALALSACMGPTGSGQQEATAAATGDWGEATGEIEFWDTNANPALSAAWEKLIDRFEQEHPDIQVEYVGLPNSSYLQKVDNALATGTVPDVMLIGNDVANLIAQNALAPLDEAYEESGILPRIDGSMLDSERENAPDGKLYKAPLSALSDVIWYRTDWLAEAGLAAPTSYDEFFAAAEELTAKQDNRFGFAFRGGPGSMPPMFAMTYGMSGIGEFFTEDGQATLDAPENVAAFERYTSLYGRVSAEADLTNDYAKIVAAFDGGSAWATHHNLGSYQDHIKALGADKVAGVQPFPDAEGVVTATTPAISGLGVLADSDRKAAAWEFVEFMSTEGNSEWVEQVGQVPANLDAQDDPWIERSQPLREIVATSENPETQYVKLPTYLPDWASICKTEMEPDFQAVLTGTMAPRDFLTKYADRFEQAQAEYEEHAKG